MITRGFLVNLGITILVSTLLFLYFRHRFKQTEHKVNTIFQLVQSHTQSTPAPPPIQFQEKNELISVSDDEPDSDSDSESDSDSDSGSEEGDDRGDKMPKEIFMGVGEIKQVAVSLSPDGHLTPSIVNPPPQNIVNDLDDIGSLSSNDDPVNVINIVKSSEKETSDQEADEESETDYSKLTVATLKELAGNKGFTNFKKLRKQALVELLSN